MFYPFLVADQRSGLKFRPSDTNLSEFSLAPVAGIWLPGRQISVAPDPVWAQSLENAPVETIAAITSSLEDLVLATPGLRAPNVDALPEGRGKRHLLALVSLWQQMGEALPDGLGAVRHVLELPHGNFIEPMPVVEGSLDPLAPASMTALYERLNAEFGAVPALPKSRLASEGTRLNALQAGIDKSTLGVGPRDDSLSFYGLRDGASCADFAAARARALMDAGAQAREIAVVTGDNPRQLARAFAAQGIALSGLPGRHPQRDVIGETALHLTLSKRTPTPAMVLASLALSPLMPWSAPIGRELAETLMGGDFRGLTLASIPAHKELWDDIRRSASSLQQLRFLLERITSQLKDGDDVLGRFSIPPGEGAPDWESILRNIQIAPHAQGEPVRNLEGVSLWSAYESPWRSCKHLIVTDFTDGLYPTRPRPNPLFLDSEIDTIRETTGLQLTGRTKGLARGLAQFNEQIQATAESITFLVPWRDLAGSRLSPSSGLSLVARVIEGNSGATELITDVSRTPPEEWPVAYHKPKMPYEGKVVPEELVFGGRDLLALRTGEDGIAKPQSPSRLETLLVSPLAWLLNEIGAEDLSWSAEELDVMAKGNIAHDVFEQVFPPQSPLPDEATLKTAVAAAYDRAISRHASFLRSPSWEMERSGLEREILRAAIRWREILLALEATTLANEVWLSGEGHGIRLHGKADTILGLPGGELLVVDHKKSGTSGRRKRMEAGWDLQAGLYRDMIANPVRKEDDGLDAFINRDVGIAYYLMNDGGLLSSGIAQVAGLPSLDMGDAVNTGALEKLTERLAELRDGKVVLNTSEDEGFFRKDAGFTPYALIDGSPLIRAFMHQLQEE